MLRYEFEAVFKPRSIVLEEARTLGEVFGLPRMVAQ